MKLSTIQEAEYRQKVVGAQEAARDFGAIEKSARGAADGQDVLAKQTDTTEKAITRVASKANAYINQTLSPMEKSLKRVEYGERLYAAALRDGADNIDALAAAVDKERAKYLALNAALNDNAVAMSLSTQNASKMAAIMSKSGGMSDPTAMTRKMSESANDAAKAAGLARHEWINLSRQGQDVAVSLYGGQSAMTVLAQQGGQIADIFSSSKGGASAALKEFGSVVAGFVLNPVTLLIGSVVALTAALAQFESQQTRLQRAANGAGAFTGMTPDQLRQAGLAGAAAGGFAGSQGIDAAATLASTGRIGGGLIPGLVSSSQRYADAFGMDQAEALKELAKAFSDPVKGAELLDEKLGFLDGQTKEYIRTLKEQGNELGAQRALFDSFESALKKTADTTWSLTRAWRLFKSGLESPVATIAGALDSALVAPKSGAQMAAERARAQRAAEERLAQRESVEISDRVTKFLPEVGSKKALEDSAAFFRDAEKNTAAMSRLGVSVEHFYKAQDIASTKLENYKTESEKAREASDFHARSLATLNERVRADLEAQKTYNDTLNATGDKELAAAKAAGVRAEASARLSAAIRELNQQARDQLELAGKSPLEQQLIRLRQQARDEAARGTYSQQAVDDRLAAVRNQYAYDTFGSPMQDIEGKRRLLDVQNSDLGKSTFAQAYDTAYMEKYNQLLKDREKITPEAVDQMNQYAQAHADLAVATEDANRRQSDFADGLDIVRSSAVDLGSSLVGAFRRGESAISALESVLDRLISKLLDKTLESAVSGLFGATGSSSAGIFGSLFKFSDGGIMTSHGPLPLRTYATGGIANSPQLAVFGEGRTPEAYVPVPSGKIPVEMRGQRQSGAKVTINNYSGANVQAQQQPNGELLVLVGQVVEEKMKREVPGILANYNRRAQ